MGNCFLINYNIKIPKIIFWVNKIWLSPESLPCTILYSNE